MSKESDKVVNATSSQPYGLSLNAREIKYIKSLLCERMQFEIQRTIDNANYTVSDEIRLCIEILDKIDTVYLHYVSDYVKSIISDNNGYCEKRPGQK